jgi:hypothetical protein
LKTRLQSQDFVDTYVSSSKKPKPQALFRGLYQGVGSVIIATLPAGTSITLKRICFGY